jgi:hypothetical protein
MRVVSASALSHYTPFGRLFHVFFFIKKSTPCMNPSGEPSKRQPLVRNPSETFQAETFTLVSLFIRLSCLISVC